MNPLIIRTDASIWIGTGHVMRCLALAQAWKKSGGSVYFVFSTHNPELEIRLVNEGMNLNHIEADIGTPEDSKVTIALAHEIGAKWIVVDGYHFNPEYHQAIRNAGFRTLLIDDVANLSIYHGNILLNQNLGSEKLSYQCDPNTKLLLGPKYVLLRKEFLKWLDWHRSIPNIAKKILITMGGSDAANVTLKVLKALQQIAVDEIEIIVVIGPNNPNYESLINECPGLYTRIERDVQNMPELMAWADIAIAAGGSSCWELAFMGLPCILVVLAENQYSVAKNAEKYGFAINLGWHKNASIDKIGDAVYNLLSSSGIRNEFAIKGRTIVDGSGPNRVVRIMTSQLFTVRKATESDCEFLWELVNDPSVRQASFNPQNVPLEDHRHWFFEKIRNPLCILLIGVDENGKPFGQVRFDITGNIAEISISIVKEYRGRGYSPVLIIKSTEYLFKNSNVLSVIANIKSENIISFHTFIECGFIFQGEKFIKEQKALQLKIEKDQILS